MAMIIPPGGFAGFSQMTPASRLALTQGTNGTRRSNGNGKRRRRKASKVAKRARATTRRTASGSRKMKFGSPAWQKKYKVGKYRK